MEKKLQVILFVIVFFIMTLPLSAQFRNQPTQPNISTILSNPQPSLFSGFLNPDKLQMHHSVSMSFGAMGGQSMMLSSYMNTIDYQFSDKLWLRANIGIMSSPYNTFGQEFYLNKPQFFGGAQLHYKISENSKITLEFNSAPFYRPMLGEFSAFGY
ncbi:hypothetical protein ACX8XP_16290 [Calditrichota bacterium LG25]